jgi:hypothetical protein
MKLSEKIMVVANWLESSNNELLIESENNEENMNKLALSLIHAADTLKDVAEEISESEVSLKSEITPEFLDGVAALASAFSESDDDLLKKQANVLDEILFTLAAPKNYLSNFKKEELDKIEELKKKYKNVNSEINEVNKVSESLDSIKDSPVYKEYRPLEAPMSSRTCIDHPGALLARVGDNTWQCSLDHKVYNYDIGFTTLKGNKVPGGSVSEQTPKHNPNDYQMFDNRRQRLFGSED